MLVELLRQASVNAAEDDIEVKAPEPYIPRVGTVAARMIEELRKLPPGGRITSTRLAFTLGVEARRFRGSPQIIAAGYVVFHAPSTRNTTGAWSLGPVRCPEFAPERRRRAELDIDADAPRVDEVSVELVGRLKESFYSAEAVTTGDSLILLAEALQAAREALARKEGGRFKGAEVDLFVARELRAISEAAMRARDNLRAAVAGML